MKLALIAITVFVAVAKPNCSPGTHVVTDQTGQPRNYAPGQGLNCEACLPGTFAEQQNQLTCTPCQVGRFSTAPRASKRLTCQVCPTGWYWPDDGAKAIAIGSSKQTDSCTICPAGKYQDRTNQRMCHSCPPGHFRSTAGATRAADCIKCNMNTLQLRKVPSAADPSVLEFVYGAKSISEACAPKDSDCLMGPWSEPTRCLDCMLLGGI